MATLFIASGGAPSTRPSPRLRPSSPREIATALALGAAKLAATLGPSANSASAAGVCKARGEGDGAPGGAGGGGEKREDGRQRTGGGGGGAPGEDKEKEEEEEVWIFAYGSLIWRPDLEFAERRQGVVRGYARRFWQASPDHRGTVERLGRVCTLVRDNTLHRRAGDDDMAHFSLSSSSSIDSSADSCSSSPPVEVHGDAYLLSPGSAAECLGRLAEREKAGYDALRVTVHLLGGQQQQREQQGQWGRMGGRTTVTAWVFAASPDSAFFVGPEDARETAAIIATARGPSGSNSEYFVRLLHAMRARGVVDEHLEELWEAVVEAHPAAKEEARRLMGCEVGVRGGRAGAEEDQGGQGDARTHSIP